MTSVRHGLFYGYGYSIAEDRLFQLDMARRTFTGRVAEVLGPDWVDHDVSVRSDVDTAAVRAQYDGLSRKDREIFEGYADGVNARIGEVMAEADSSLPKEYGDSGFHFRPSALPPRPRRGRALTCPLRTLQPRGWPLRGIRQVVRASATRG